MCGRFIKYPAHAGMVFIFGQLGNTLKDFNTSMHYRMDCFPIINYLECKDKSFGHGLIPLIRFIKFGYLKYFGRLKFNIDK